MQILVRLIPLGGDEPEMDRFRRLLEQNINSKCPR